MKQIIILGALFVATSCSDMLDITNKENVARDYFNKGEKEAIQLVNSAYAVLQKDSYFSRFLITMAAIRSDEGCLSPNAAKMEESFTSLALYNNNAAEKFTDNLWSDTYSGILRTNVALEYVPIMNISDESKARIMGEAYFLRATFNFYLVLNYGEKVPVKRKFSLNPDSFEQIPGKDGELWELIMSDYLEAQRLFTTIQYKNTSSKYELGRANLGAATAFLGQTYLYYAQLKGDSEYYQKAADEFAKVISGEVGTYDLMLSYRDNFTNESEYNKESLFEIGYGYEGTDVWGINSDDKTCAESNWMAKNSGMTSNCSGEAPRWWNLAPANALSRYYEPGDYRKWYTLWCDGGAYYMDNEGVHVYDNAMAPYLSMGFPENPYEKGEGEKYLGYRKYEFDYNHAQINATSDPSLTSISSKYDGMSDINFRVMRFADVLLMYAECQIVGGIQDRIGISAKECIGRVRRRANNQLTPMQDNFQYTYGNTLLPYFSNKGALSDDYSRSADLMVQLQHERFIELAGEGKRYFDIIRWFKAGLLKDIDPESPTFESPITSISALSSMLKTPSFTGKFLLPIPQYELNANPNMVGNESN